MTTVHSEYLFLHDIVELFGFYNHVVRYISNSNKVLVFFFYGKDQEERITIELTKGLLNRYEGHFYFGSRCFYQDKKDYILKQIREYKLKKIL